MITLVKRLAILLFIQVTFFSLVHADEAQDMKNFYNTLLPDFQKLTPEASALGQYGKYSNSGYTGVPNIPISLLTIGSRDFSMPIELSYDASGIKVEQHATYVGLGWNLIMGGSINQILCGQNDFRQKTYSIYPSSNLDLLQTVLPDIKYIQSPYAGCPSVRFESLPYVLNENATGFPLEEDKKKYDILRDVSIGAIVPDIFQATFCGKSVYFTIDTSSKKARIIDNNATNYKIELKEYTGNYPHSIEITDDHGLKYIFTEAPKNSMEDQASYNLSKIKNYANHILAEFKYSEVGYTLLQPYYETIGKRDESYNRPIASQAIQKQFIDRNYPQTLTHVIKDYYPSTIITDKEIVTFIYGDREDIKGTKRIDKITVKSISNKDSIIHTVDFKYGYFTESRYESTLCNRYNYTSVYGYKRLKLTDITVDGKNYSFGYNEGNELPSRLSTRQDFWGYFNGQSNYSTGFCASPEYQYDKNGKLTGLESVGPANRYANEDCCKVGILNKITYPTGGYTKFAYEINHFNDVNGKYYYPSATSASSIKYVKTESCSSGYNGKGYNTTPDKIEFDVNQATKVEIASSSPYYPSTQQYYKLYLDIVGKDSIGNKVFSKSYTKYNDKQDFKETYVLPKGHYIMTSQFLNVADGLKIGGGIKVSFPPEYKENLSFADASGKSIGGGLRIKKIENYDSNNELINSTQYKYEGGKLLIPTVKKELIFMTHSSTTTKDCRFFFITSSPTYPAICSLGCPNIGYSKVTKENCDKSGKLMSYDIEKYNNEGYTEYGDDVYFNLFRVNTDGLNGKQTEAMTYSKNSVLMRKVCYSYTTFGKNPELKDIVFFPWSRCLDTNPGQNSLDVSYKYSLYPKYIINVLPSTVTETNYANGTAMKPVTTTYEYNTNNYQHSKITKSVSLDSKTNDVVTTQYWYPNDSEISSSNPSYLTKANCISEIVKAKTFKNGNTVGGYRNVYGALSNGLPVVKKNYSIDTSNGERIELDVTNHDDYGNIREYKKKNGTPVTIIWSYNHQCPILEIDGCTYKRACEVATNIPTLEGKVNITDDAITSIHNKLQAALKNEAYVTAYIYSPWHSLKSVVKPNGYAVNYGYDSYGRLTETKDASGILQKYSYNYKNK